MTPVTIALLQKGFMEQRIRLKIVRAWERRASTTNAFLEAGFLATDKNGDAIHVQIQPMALDLHRHLIIEGSIYMLSNFKVTMPQVSFVAVKSSIMIWLTRTSIINPIMGDISIYPEHYFDFNSETKLHQMADEERFLADIIGKLLIITEEEKIHAHRTNRIHRRRRLRVLTLHNQVLDISINDKQLDQQNEEELLKIVPRPVIIFAGMVVRKAVNGIQLISCIATRLYINLPTNETAMVKSIYDHVLGPAQLIPADLF
ncbi:Nucleic acid-binding protein [Corchorus olitorius]|uniref:Nucleic acid-binding protein n=1 Tax=Corchorus olitorius TaxID=93759 RepID=A0A1R3HCA0_9ROSI|nr:Nucleic acid-binding protein [Corchorus olitorius]